MEVASAKNTLTCTLAPHLPPMNPPPTAVNSLLNTTRSTNPTTTIFAYYQISEMVLRASTCYHRMSVTN